MIKRLLSAFIAVGVMAANLPKVDFTSNAATTISISPFNKYEINDGIFEGWGTSLCWWANRVGYNDVLTQKAAEAFFGDSGLRMNIARFNIGGGDNPSHTHITRTDSNMPGYTVYNNGTATYDWSKDANQRNVLLKAIDACSEDLHVEMFSNSPPYYMTKSGCSTGGSDPNKNNLKDDCYDDFAEYLATVCEHYEKDWGVKVDSVEAMNEPYTNFWGQYSAKQEGCHFDIGNSESTIIEELQKSMQKRGLNDVIICGTDETSIDTQISAFNALSNNAKKALSRIDTHTYGGSKRSELKNLALQNGKNLWMSEVDGNGTAGSNAGQMSAGLWLAQRMMDDCNGLNPSAWILWQVIDNHISSVGYNGNKDKGMVNTNGGFWGLAVADHDKNEIIYTKKYYVFGQFSRYIRPGFTMLETGGSTVAAYDEKNHQLVIVALNASGSNNSVDFDLSQFNDIGDKVEVIRTSGDINSGENWKNLSPISTSNNGFSASLLANSVTTFIVDGVYAPEKLSLTEIPLNKSMVTGSDAWKGSANDCTKVVDGDTSTYFDGVSNGWVQIDLGQTYDLSAIAFAPRSGYEFRSVDAKIAVSTDGVNWTTVHSIDSQPSSRLNYITKLSTNKNIRYVRYFVPEGAPKNPYNKDSSYCCNIAEIKVYGEISGMDNRIPLNKDMVTGSNPWGGSSNDCTKVVDGNTSTFFDGVGNGWVQIDLGKNYKISTLAYAPRSGYEYRCIDGEFSGSTDGVNWTKIAVISQISGSGMQYINFENPADFRYIRFQVPDGKPQNSSNKDNVYCCNIAEIAVYGEESSAIGDVNGDGSVDISDAVTLQKYILTSQSNIAIDCDLNGDKLIDIFDLAALKKIIIS